MEMKKKTPGLAGRNREIELLRKAYSDACEGSGKAIILSGEAGIGKTRLIDEFLMEAMSEPEVTILSSSASPEFQQPFSILTQAMEKDLDAPLLVEHEYTTFTDLFIVDRAGILIAQANIGSDMELDADIFASMLSAVQSFVRDSLDKDGGQGGGLGRLEYGDMKILIEHGNVLFLTGIIRGEEHAGMKDLLGDTVRDIEERHMDILENWNGQISSMAPIKDILSELSKARFLVKRDLEGIRIENERLMIAGKCLEKLSSMAKNGPMILVLEDLQWSDDASLFVINYILRNLSDKRILLIATLRPGLKKELEEFTGSLESDGIHEMIKLSRLEDENIIQLIEGLYPGHALPADYIERMIEESGGNPFFLLEMLRQMEVEGSIILEGEKTVLVNKDYSIPTSVEDIVLRRLDLLDPDALAMAEYSSCIGRVFDTDIAMTMASIKAPKEALDKLRDNGLVTVNEGRVEFSHTIFRDVIYDMLGERWKAVYHRSLGEYYEKTYKNQLDDVAYELARHYSKSNVHQKGMEYNMRAGEIAESSYAPELAIGFYIEALITLKRLRSGNENKVLEIKLRLNMGQNLQMTGEWNGAEEYYRTGMQIAKDIGEPKILAESHNFLGELLRNKGSYDEAYEQFTKANALFEKIGDRVGMSHTLGNLGVVHYNKGDYDRAIDHYQKEYDIASQLEHRRGMSHAIGNMAVIYYYTDQYEKAMRSNLKKLELAEELDDKIGISIAYGNMGGVHRELGNTDKAMECYQKKFDIAREVGDKLGMSIVLGNIGSLHMQLGEAEKALESHKKEYEISQEIGDKLGVSIANGNIGKAYQIIGEYDRADEYYTKAITLSRELDSKYWLCEQLFFKAELMRSLDRLSESEELCRESISLASELKREELLGDAGSLLKELNITP